MPDIQKMLVAAHLTKQRYDEFLLRATVTSSRQCRISAYLCLTIAEQFDAAICLIENQLSSHSPVFVRSMLEGFADLQILVADASHLDQMTYESATVNADIFERYSQLPEMQPDDPKLADLLAYATASASERDALKTKGRKKVSAKDKLEKAGLGGTYASYRLLCGYAHNDITMLEVRHAGPYLRYHHEAPPETTVGMLNTAFRLLSEAVSLLPEFTNIQADELIAARIILDAQWAEAAA